MIRAFHSNSLDLWRINNAIITVIPKGEGASTLNDYRPISVINGIIKIAKIKIPNKIYK